MYAYNFFSKVYAYHFFSKVYAYHFFSIVYAYHFFSKVYAYHFFSKVYAYNFFSIVYAYHFFSIVYAYYFFSILYAYHIFAIVVSPYTWRTMKQTVIDVQFRITKTTYLDECHVEIPLVSAATPISSTNVISCHHLFVCTRLVCVYMIVMVN